MNVHISVMYHEVKNSVYITLEEFEFCWQYAQ